jgi:hypothetical protein
MQKTVISNRKMTYGTRRLKAGDEFTTSARDADILVRLGKASEVPPALAQSNFKVPTTPPAPPVAPVQQTTPADDNDGDENPLKAVRDEYEQVVGKRPFHGWDEAELRRRMAEHQSP